MPVIMKAKPTRSQGSGLKRPSIRLWSLKFEEAAYGQSSRLGIFFVRVPYYVWDLKRAPNSENCPSDSYDHRMQAAQDYYKLGGSAKSVQVTSGES